MANLITWFWATPDGQDSAEPELMRVERNGDWTETRHIDGRKALIEYHIVREAESSEIPDATEIDPDAQCPEHGCARATCSAEH